MSPPIYKIALIQLYPKPMQLEANYLKAASFVTSAASQGAHLAILPEYHLTNWVPDDPKFVDLCSQWQAYLNKYRALAREHNICIVPGTIVEFHPGAENDDDKLINVAYFISNTGDILGSYQKKNLWHPERPHLTSSAHDPHTIIHSPLGPIGLLICWDLAFPEAFRALISQGAKIIIIPTLWTLSDCSPYGLSLNPRAEALFLASTVTARAYENTCAVAFVNAGGPVGKDSGTYAGLSRLTVPFLGALEGETNESAMEGMSIVELDMNVLEEAEKQYKVREDLAREDWHYGYEKGKL